MKPLYHATADANLAGIVNDGVRPNSYWTSNMGVLNYYLSFIEDEGAKPITLTCNLEFLNPRDLLPDRPGIEEPITMALGLSQSVITKRWQNSRQDWKASLRIVGSLKVAVRIPPKMLSVRTANGDINLENYLSDSLQRPK